MKTQYKKASRLSHLFLVIFFVTLITTVLFSLKLAFLSSDLKRDSEEKIAYRVVAFESPTPSPTITTRLSPKSSVKSAKDSYPWGVAKKLDETTWTMKVGEDENMAAPQEIFEALNSYRRQKGTTTLVFDQNLASFAQKRAENFLSLGKLDGHAGFNDYFKDEQNLKNVGFWGVGENSSFGFKMSGVHLIEWLFAADSPHDNNQLDSSWTHVGIGVAGSGVDIVFGTSKM